MNHKPKVYIDGQAGTTGLQIADRLAGRNDLELLKLPDELRHNDQARASIMKEADLVFLCLPDQAALEAVELVDENTKIIDASTAHRTVWDYGFPELDESMKEKIIHSKRVANPGCHASGVIALVYPLIQAGLLEENAFLSIFSITGYTGGGKKMIHDYETADRKENPAFFTPAAYGLKLNHKHIPEIVKITGLQKKPAFVPVVDQFAQGMEVSIVLEQDMLKKKMSPESLLNFYQMWYENALGVKVAECQDNGSLYAGTLAGKDWMEIHVNGNDEQILLSALFDNLGKGASGAAVQNMNLMLGLEEKAGLNLD